MANALRILMIEDAEDDFLIIRHELSRAGLDCHCARVETRQELANALGQHTWSIVLSDYNLPKLPFQEAFAMIQDAQPALPVIVVSGVIDEAVAVEVMRTGVKDYILKDSLSRLVPAIRRECADAESKKERLGIERFVARSGEVMKRIALGAATSEIMSDICLMVDTLCEGTACAVFSMSEDGKTLRLGAAPKMSEAYHAAVGEFAIGPTVCTCGTAAFTKQVVITEDISTNPLWDGYRDIEDFDTYLGAWSSPLIDSNGMVIGTYAQYFLERRGPSQNERDIIERAKELAAVAIQRQRDEAALRASEAKLRAMADSTQLSIVMVDPLGQSVLFANRRMREMLENIDKQACPVEALHRSFDAFAVSAEEFAQFKADFLSGKLDHTNGEELWNDGRFIRWGASTVLSESGGVLGRVLTLDDISDYRHLEERLRQASKLEAIGTLAGGIAHDFNNILTPIMGLATLGLSEDDFDKTRVKRWQTILESSRRGRDLIRKILSFSRRSEVNTRRVNLSELVRETIGLLKEALPSTIQVDFGANQEDCFVDGDPASLEQVIMNLATNAFHAMEAKGGTLQLTIHPIERQDLPMSVRNISKFRSYLELKVRDTGRGVAPEDLTRIFDPFFTTKPVGKGTGLGLSQAIGIVQAHDGDMRVESQVGVGTTFTILLPRADASSTPTTPVRVSLTRSNSDARILIADDEESIRELLAECLTGCGYTVDIVADGQVGYDLIAANPTRYQLLITDQTMPRMTGTELIRKLRNNKISIPIILCTGVIDARFSAELQHLGVNASLAKPISLDLLTASVAEVLLPNASSN